MLIYEGLKITENLKVLQQNYYNENNRYLKWGWKNLLRIINVIDIFLFFINIINLYLQSKILLYLNILYLINIVRVLYTKKNHKDKLPLKYTNRIIRLYICILVLNILSFILLIFNYNYYIILLISTFIVCNYLLVFLANVINKPIEKLVYLYYKGKAKKKLKTINPEVIGITGSYGKTSTKNILNTILNVNYNAITTPGSYNTLYGLILTINNKLSKYDDYFIAEMGAFKRGSIKKLCKLVKPKYGIITNIGKAHLETFKSVENIKKGKFELVDSLPEDGVAILNNDDVNQQNYHSKCKVITISINNESDVRAKNIKISSQGMSFDVVFKETKEVGHFTTQLLGYANVYNILAAVALGKYLNMSIPLLQLGVNRIKPIEHRLELKNINDVIYIDDAYNSNPIGSKMALDTLALLEGTKVIITPGMIELGPEQDNINFEFGSNIAKSADIAILVGRKQTEKIYEGLIKNNMKKENIYIIDNLTDSFKIITEIKNKGQKVNVLIENDLPDIYNEK